MSHATAPKLLLPLLLLLLLPLLLLRMRLVDVVLLAGGGGGGAAVEEEEEGVDARQPDWFPRSGDTATVRRAGDRGDVPPRGLAGTLPLGEPDIPTGELAKEIPKMEMANHSAKPKMPRACSALGHVLLIYSRCGHIVSVMLASSQYGVLCARHTGSHFGLR